MDEYYWRKNHIATRSGKTFDAPQVQALQTAIQRSLLDSLGGVDPKRLLTAVQSDVGSAALKYVHNRAWRDVVRGTAQVLATPSKMAGQIIYSANVTVDRRPSIEELARENGWGACNPFINSNNFQHDNRPEVEELPIHVVRYGSVPDSDAIVGDMRVGDMAPISIDILLNFGKEFAELHSHYHLVGLGSAYQVNGVRVYPALINGAHRHVDLVGWEEHWFPIHLFGAVKIADFKKNVA